MILLNQPSTWYPCFKHESQVSRDVHYDRLSTGFRMSKKTRDPSIQKINYTKHYRSSPIPGLWNLFAIDLQIWTLSQTNSVLKQTLLSQHLPASLLARRFGLSRVDAGLSPGDRPSPPGGWVDWSMFRTFQGFGLGYTPIWVVSAHEWNRFSSFWLKGEGEGLGFSNESCTCCANSCDVGRNTSYFQVIFFSMCIYVCIDQIKLQR